MTWTIARLVADVFVMALLAAVLRSLRDLLRRGRTRQDQIETAMLNVLEAQDEFQITYAAERIRLMCRGLSGGSEGVGAHPDRSLH